MADYRAAKDIPDEVFLDAIREARRRLPRSMVSRWQVATVLAGHPALLDNDTHAGQKVITQDWPGVPPKVVLAKARKLIERKVIEGCGCGCRGDFEIPGETQIAPRGSVSMTWLTKDGVTTVPWPFKDGGDDG